MLPAQDGLGLGPGGASMHAPAGDGGAVRVGPTQARPGVLTAVFTDAERAAQWLLGVIQLLPYLDW